MRYLKNIVVYYGQFSMYVVSQEGRKDNDMFCLWEWRFILLSSPLLKCYQVVLRCFLLVFYKQHWKICKNIPSITYSLQFLYPQPLSYISIAKKVQSWFSLFYKQTTENDNKLLSTIFWRSVKFFILMANLLQEKREPSH